MYNLVFNLSDNQRFLMESESFEFLQKKLMECLEMRENKSEDFFEFPFVTRTNTKGVAAFLPSLLNSYEFSEETPPVQQRANDAAALLEKVRPGKYT